MLKRILKNSLTCLMITVFVLTTENIFADSSQNDRPVEALLKEKAEQDGHQGT